MGTFILLIKYFILSYQNGLYINKYEVIYRVKKVIRNFNLKQWICKLTFHKFKEWIRARFARDSKKIYIYSGCASLKWIPWTLDWNIVSNFLIIFYLCKLFFVLSWGKVTDINEFFNEICMLKILIELMLMVKINS